MYTRRCKDECDLTLAYRITMEPARKNAKQNLRSELVSARMNGCSTTWLPVSFLRFTFQLFVLCHGMCDKGKTKRNPGSWTCNPGIGYNWLAGMPIRTLQVVLASSDMLLLRYTCNYRRPAWVG